MSIENIFIILLLVLAAIYLIYKIRKQTKSHDCDKCGLMEMQKEKEKNL